MAKQGMRKNDANTQRSGRNNPEESMAITTGSYKKRETYEAQARAHEDPGKQGQVARAPESTRDQRTGNTTRVSRPGSRRSGSNSNAG